MFSLLHHPTAPVHRHSHVPSLGNRIRKQRLGCRLPTEPQKLMLVHASGPAPLVFVEGYTEVEELAGARLVVDGDTPRVEYLTKWKDGSGDTWETAANLSDDLVRDFEEKWWTAARKADLDTMIKMLGGARELLANVVDENRRSALHFAAALGSVECTKLLVEAGADLNLQDREGFTPLHMAAGYMHTSTMAVLLEAGANPELKDNNGRDVVSLVEGLRSVMPLNMSSVQRRLALEEVANCLTDRLYDEVAPSNVLNMRNAPDGSREFLVSFPDGRDDEWLPERNVGADVREDFLAGLEYAEAEELLDVVQVGLEGKGHNTRPVIKLWRVRTERRFKVKWGDGYPTSWEREEHVPPELIALFAAQNPQLFSERTSAEASSSAAAAGGWAELGVEDPLGEGYETQAAPMASAQRQQQHTSDTSNGSGGNYGIGSGSGITPATDAQQELSQSHEREAVGAGR